LEWERLLTDQRLGEKSKLKGRLQDGRSEFQKDFDRIVFSPAFRRLQDKTQVFPLPESDFVHTRLTHSLEVSCVGRSLGNLVGETVIKRNASLKDRFTKFHFGEIVAAACLAHDIGNPPFGHSGEDAISEYFRNGNGQKFRTKTKDEKKWFDLIKYEGNAQGFRIITKLQNPRVMGGLNLTYSTLAAITKYPRESVIYNKSKSLLNKAYRKHGFFQAEKDIFKEVASNTGLNCLKSEKTYWWCRHPLAFLVEAADDVCYRVMDLEDGFRLGLVMFKETEEMLIPLINRQALKGYKEKDEKDRIGYLRALAISELVNEIAKVFLEEEKNILAGKFENDLISEIRKAKTLKKTAFLNAMQQPISEPVAGNFLIIGDAAAPAETWIQGAFACGYQAARVAAKELDPTEYIDWWKKSFYFNDPKFVQDYFKLITAIKSLNLFFSDEEIDYLYSLLDGRVFTSIPQQFEELSKLSDKICKERPELCERIRGWKGI